MKNKFIMITAATASLMALMSFSAFAANAGWVKSGDSWRYQSSNGDYVTDTWKQSGNDYYYLDDNGYMSTDSLIDDGDYCYYVDKDGKRVSDTWMELTDDDDTYWYYFQNSGKSKENGFETINGKKYHFSDNHMDYGWLEDGNNEYYLGASNEGWAATGWKWIDESFDDDNDNKEDGWYYFEASGKLVTEKEKSINGQHYVFNSEGLMLDNWVGFTDAAGDTVYKYFVEGEGNRASGWLHLGDIDSDDNALETEEGWYYFKNGIPYTATYKTTSISPEYGVAKISSKIYCFDDLGQMQTGTVTGSDGSIFYFGSDGAMKTGKVKIEDSDDYDDETMYFNTNGSLGDKGSSYTGVKNGYLYDNGFLVEAEDDNYELVTVDAHTYIVNEHGKIKTSGTVKLDDDTKMKITSRADGLGYDWTVVQ